MDMPTFVGLIHRYILPDCVRSICENLGDPPTRKPSEQQLAMAKWYHEMPAGQQKMLAAVVHEAAFAATFQLFCVLDHVVPIEERHPPGHFELYYVNQNQRVLLNDPPLCLHDELRSLEDEDQE